MFNELWAKVSAREKLVVYGALIALVGVVVGLILATKSYGGGSVGGYTIPGVSVNYFTAENAGLFALLALVGGVATLGIIYAHVAQMNVQWPAPYAQVLMVVAVATAVCAILIVLMQLIRAGGFGDGAPIFMFVADILAVAGGCFMAYVTYMDWTAAKGA